MSTEVAASERAAARELGFDAPAAVRGALAELGRTEDMRLAPSGHRLAFACYARRQVAVADVEIDVSSSGPEIAVTSLAYLDSPGLDKPHGLDFVDDETVVVGDREAGVLVFRLPAAGADGALTRIGAVDGGMPPLLDSPGSVAVRSLDAGGHELLACNNWVNTVTRHALGADGVVGAGEVLLRKRLDLPDGIAVSHDGQWLAVSSHDSNSVFVYDVATAHEGSEPIGVLRGFHYPHGLRFGPEDRYLAVADAGAPHVHLFVPSDRGWHGARYPSATIRVMDDETFARGRLSLAEGGPKGLDIDPRANVLMTTAECAPLAFFDVEAALAGDAVARAEEAVVRYELDALEERKRLAATADEAKAQLDEVMQTKAWRMTLPMRRAYGAARRLKPRRRRS